MQTIIPISDTINLTLYQEADKPILVRFMNDPVFQANTSTLPNPYTKTDADIWLDKTKQARVDFKVNSKWAIRHVSDGLVGGIDNVFVNGEDAHLDAIGYWIAPPYRGQGIMSRVVDIYSNWLFQNTGLVRIEAYVFAHNKASARVLEKAGFEREGLLRKKYLKNGVLTDAFLYARLKE